MPTLAGGSEYPRIILPAALDEVQLRDLLGVCPNFDSARAQARDQWWADNPGTSHYPEILPEPIIIIEAPSGTEDQAALDAYYRKHEILYEAANAHYQSQVTTESHAPSEPSAT